MDSGAIAAEVAKLAPLEKSLRVAM